MRTLRALVQRLLHSVQTADPAGSCLHVTPPLRRIPGVTRTTRSSRGLRPDRSADGGRPAHVPPHLRPVAARAARSLPPVSLSQCRSPSRRSSGRTGRSPPRGSARAALPPRTADVRGSPWIAIYSIEDARYKAISNELPHSLNLMDEPVVEALHDRSTYGELIHETQNPSTGHRTDRCGGDR